MQRNKSIRIYLIGAVGLLLILFNRCTKDNSNVVSDNDGNSYHSVTIGSQVWLDENLKTKKYQNGELIGTTTPSNENIADEDSPKYQWPYGGNETNVATYGRLYTWYAITDSRNVCPVGWRVPTDADWIALTTYLGGESVAGGKLKEAGTTHWVTPNTGSTNESGFTALPSGPRDPNGSFGTSGHDGNWWSSSSFSAMNAYSLSMFYDDVSAGMSDNDKHNGYSVRCVKNN
jgi:uncharacterized protein (TIGR02145 family)